jgi:hypothetical protein
LIPSERVPWFRERRVAVAVAVLIAALFAGRIIGWVVGVTGIHALRDVSSPAAKVVGAIGFVYAVMVIFETYNAARGTSDDRDTGR